MINASPRYQTPQFIADLKRIIREKEIDLLVPQFEELFNIASHLDQFKGLTEVFLSPFETLARFYDKAAFVRLCEELPIRVPRTTIVTDKDTLKKAAGDYEQYFTRASFSRGGVELLTNTGLLANATKIDNCHPTPQNPWLAQEFVHGTDLCSFSVVQSGRLTIHRTYEHPKTLEHRRHPVRLHRRAADPGCSAALRGGHRLSRLDLLRFPQG
ncbi:MAG: hypothetical protein SWK76_17685 [Actinomycetota bacterium]|nr:hypothetical protein [Actinomycetota bacterium]